MQLLQLMSEDSWHLSKSVPITLIFGLLVQGAAIVWTVSMMMSDIEANREDIVAIEQRMGRLEDSVQSQAVALARIDENIKAIRSSVEKMAND
jgi:type VI protein secretion system component VasK